VHILVVITRYLRTAACYELGGAAHTEKAELQNAMLLQGVAAVCCAALLCPSSNHDSMPLLPAAAVLLLTSNGRILKVTCHL
jgi:hypothetical protein